MKFSELVTIRQSVRKYQNKPIEREKIEQAIEAVRLAPSACNSQPWKLIIVDEPDLKDKVAQASSCPGTSLNKFVPQAPVIAVLTLEKATLSSQIGGMMKNREFPLIDIGVAAEHFCLQAAELGLGTCMLGWFDERTIKRLLHIPRRTRIGLLITLGYAEEEYPLRKKIRKDTEVMSSFNRYT
ncbi:MAG: NAD(P)H nitroreductase [bacterium]|nr:NAD(P)H nitroreductase [bacterium]